MKDLVKYIVDQLVDDKSAVCIESEVDGEVETITIKVAENDIGKVIGKQGKIAKAMRTIVRSATPANSKKYVIEICERGGNAVDVDTTDEE